MQKFCVCGNTGTNFSKCGRCLSKYYCSVECQRRDWKQHKPHCDRRETNRDVRYVATSWLKKYLQSDDCKHLLNQKRKGGILFAADVENVSVFDEPQPKIKWMLFPRDEACKKLGLDIPVECTHLFYVTVQTSGDEVSVVMGSNV